MNAVVFLECVSSFIIFCVVLYSMPEKKKMLLRQKVIASRYRLNIEKDLKVFIDKM